jgi:hypothetical protein
MAAEVRAITYMNAKAVTLMRHTVAGFKFEIQ